MSLQVTITETGLSDPITLPARGGRYIVRLYDPLGGAFEADLQLGDNGQFDDLYTDPTTKATIKDADTPKGFEIPAGCQVLANVKSLANPLTLIGSPIGS